MTGPQEPPGPEHPEVGSVGEEAAKLFGALSYGAMDTDGEPEGGAAPSPGSTFLGLAGQAAARLGAVNEHIATGSAECTFCPVCRTVHVIRGTSPEVRAHLAEAASSLLQAVAGVLATVPPAPGGPGGAEQTDRPDETGRAGPSGQVQRIDLDGDDDA